MPGDGLKTTDVVIAQLVDPKKEKEDGKEKE